MSVRLRTFKFVDFDGNPLKLSEEEVRFFRTKAYGLLDRIKKARLRKAKAERINEALTPQLKANWPESLARVTIAGHRTIEASMRPTRKRRVKDPQAFLAALGSNADQVVDGIKMPPTIVLSDARNLPALVELVRERFPEAQVDLGDFELLVNWDTLKALEEQKEVKIPDGVVDVDLKARQLFIEYVS